MDEGCDEREEHLLGSASAGRQGLRTAVNDAGALGRHADYGRHDEGSENAEKTNEHRGCVDKEEK